jgi:hypothetical protein
MSTTSRRIDSLSTIERWVYIYSSASLYFSIKWLAFEYLYQAMQCLGLHTMPPYITWCHPTQNNTLDPARFSMCTHIMCCNHIYLYTVKHGTLFTCKRHRCLSDLISIQSYISKSAYLPTILLLQHDSNTFYGANTTITKLTANQDNCYP